MKGLTPTQERVVEFISSFRTENSIPPTVREIADHFGYKSTNAVRQHLRLIEQKGRLRLWPNKARGIEVLSDLKDGPRHTSTGSVEVPILGKVAAGTPITAVENHEGTIALDKNFFRGADLFTLRVNGLSMVNAGILDGDIVVINKQDTPEIGEIMAVSVNNEVTLKRYYIEGNDVLLKAENPHFKDIRVPLDQNDVTICGKMVGVLRQT